MQKQFDYNKNYFMTEFKKFSELNVKIESKRLLGQKQHLTHVLGKEIVVHAFQIKPSKFPGKSDRCLYLQYSEGGKMYVAFSIAKYLMEVLEALPESAFPFSTTISNKNEIYEFT
jgi:hypothetical protein